MKETPERIQLLLKQVVDYFDKEDRPTREKQIRQWRQLKYYWDGFQKIWYSETAHDWRVYDKQLPDDASYYDKPINVFRAYLESIIAALSISIPSIKCAPDDADNPLDLSTAKAGDKIADLIYKHNDVILLWLHALYVYCTEGMVACYNYSKEDYEFGSYSENKYDDVEEEQDISACPTCGNEMPQPGNLDGITDLLSDEFDPDPEDVVIADLLNSGNYCPECQQEVIPLIQKKKVIVTRLVGTTTKPKARQCLEVYGGLYVKIPNYACKQSDIPYLIYSYETHYTNAIERYEHLREKFAGKSRHSSNATYERWGRLPMQYSGDYSTDISTIRNVWLRTSSFNILNDEKEIKELKKLYPNGVKVVMVNDHFAEAENESLDDHWTLSQNPLSDFLHHDPLGLLLVSVQEITNDLTSLVLQTIEHGIPQTFADPEVLDFNAYGKSEVSPGSIYPAKARSGKTLGEGFYEVRTASLSAEVLPFAQKVQEMGQLVTGALPSLFGGIQSSGSKTAAQYSMSRAQALQRLQTPWKMFTIWWKNIFGKVIPQYMKDVKDDEKNVIQDKMGNWINVYIRKAELEGKIGNVELEASEQLPVTWAQRKDVIMQLMQAGNPIIMQALTSPENVQLLAEIIGLDDFVIPGEDDRAKQYEEIKQLLDSEPMQMPDGSEQPAVEVDPLIDNHAIESEICHTWLISEAGRLAKIENAAGYHNVLLHMQGHVMIMQQNAAASQQMQQPEEQQKPGKVIPMAAKLPKGASNAPAS